MRVSLLSLHLILDSVSSTICSARFQTAVSQIEKAWDSSFCTPGPPCTLPQDYAIRMGCGLCAKAPIRVAHHHFQVAVPQRLRCQLLLDFEVHFFDAWSSMKMQRACGNPRFWNSITLTCAKTSFKYLVFDYSFHQCLELQVEDSSTKIWPIL